MHRIFERFAVIQQNEVNKTRSIETVLTITKTQLAAFKAAVQSERIVIRQQCLVKD
jgi:hypothetical protein